MVKQPRWMKSVIAASTEVQVTMPWARGTRRRPAALSVPAKAKPQQPTPALAAR